MLVYIVRHGETNENRLGIIQGQMDTQLNQAGREQAATTGVTLKDVNFVAAYSSDSSRAADTARAILSHHPTCQLVLDPGLRERFMGSLSGTKAPARRPLPPNVETSRSISKRLTNFWDNTLIPLFISASTTTLTATSESSPEIDSANSEVSAEPAVLLVSHGATISKLIRDTLLVEHGYTVTCDISRHGIYNTSISILRLSISREGEGGILLESTGDEAATTVEPSSISGELFQFASISHLIRRKDVVKENADMLERQGARSPSTTRDITVILATTRKTTRINLPLDLNLSSPLMFFQTRNLYHLRVNKHTVIPVYLYLDENHVDWMTRSILNEIIADLKPLIGPKLVKESHIGASGLSASAMKKAGQSAVEVHRGENYQFAYFLKPAESYDLLVKTRDFVAVAKKSDDPPTPIEHTPTPEPPKTKRGKPTRKRAPKAKSRPRMSSAAKKRKRNVIDDDEEDAEMSDAWSDLDKSLDGSAAEENSDVPTPSGTAPTRRSARQKNISPAHDVDEQMDQDETTTVPQEVPPVIVKSEPDDTSALASLLPISGEDGTPAPPSQSPRPPSDHIVIDEEDEKPKQELHLTYAGSVIPSRCLCVIAEPWPALPTAAQLIPQTTRRRPRKPASPKPAAKSRPLFRADSDDEDEEVHCVASSQSPEPEFDSDDEQGRLKLFSQMINKVGERRSGVAARSGIEEFEDDALYGDADEDGRGI